MINTTERRASIENYIANGICHLCKTPVSDGDPVYSVTMAHWECHEKLKNEFAVANAPRLRSFIGIPNGGWLTHLVVDGDKSLCGHKPKDTARLMKRRGRWREVEITRVITCAGCVKKHGRDVL